MKYVQRVKAGVVSVYEDGEHASSMPVFQIAYDNAFERYDRDLVIMKSQAIPNDPVQALLYIGAVREAITRAMGEQTAILVQQQMQKT